MKFAICNEIFKDCTPEETFRAAARIGYDAVEIAPFTLADSVTDIMAAERERIRRAAQEVGIEISGIHWVLARPEGLYINHPDAGIRKRTADYFVELVRFCSDIGGRFIVVGSPRQRQVMEGVSPEQADDWALETFRPAVRLAEGLGVTICPEPLSPVETNFLNTAEETVRFTKRLDSKAFKIILDVKAMYSEGKPIPEIIRACRGDFAYFHANDRNLKGPGFGDVDFVPILAELRRVGYDGYVSVEVFKFEEGAEVIASRSLETLKNALAAADEPGGCRA